MTVRDSITRTGARTPGAEDYPTSMAAHGRAPIPTQCGITAVVSTCAKGRHKPNISRCMPGAGLSRSMRGKVLPYMPAFQPYRGKPAVRNDREGRGNVGIIRSPVRASTLPDCGGREVTRVPTAKSLQSRVSLADSGHRHRVALWCWWLPRPALTRPMGRGASADVVS
jgi:hypothetical protein